MEREFMIRTERYAFHAVEWPGSQRKIIGIHGLTGNCFNLQALAQSLSPQYSFIGYDLRGRGYSSKSERHSSYLTHAHDLLGIIQSLELKKPILIGYSMGALIAAQTAALTDNIEAIVMLDGGAEISEENREGLRSVLQRTDRIYPAKEEYIENARKFYEALGVQWNEYLEKYVLYEIEQKDNGFGYRGDLESIESDLESIISFNPEVVYPNIKCPVLLVYASTKKDPAPRFQPESAYDKAKKLIPNLEFYVTGNNHHTLVLYKQWELNEVVKKFIERCHI